jgi:hypothetical protein
MTARTPPASDTATRARRAAIAAEVRAALDALERALVAGAEVPDDLTLQMIIDDLGVVASDLALVDRDLREHGQ